MSVEKANEQHSLLPRLKYAQRKAFNSKVHRWLLNVQRQWTVDEQLPGVNVYKRQNEKQGVEDKKTPWPLCKNF